MTELYLVDGGFSSQLSRHVGEDNVTEKDNPLWCSAFLSSNKQALIDTHRDYVRAGCDIITTNTYQASVEGFVQHLGLSEEQSVKLIQDAVKFAKEAILLEEKRDPAIVNRHVRVAGSLGSYGAFLHDGSEYRGDFINTVTKQELIDYHRPRIEALIQGGIDVLAIETLPAQEEAVVLAELIKEYPSLKAWISFSCKDEKHTCHNDKFGVIAREIYARNPAQLVAVGVNCLAPHHVEALLMSAGKEIPLICYPNSGETFDPGQKMWINKDTVPTVDIYVPRWLDAGVKYVGGCCRTNADDMKKFRKIIDERLLTRL
uniref:Selenocysteine Se-methyltransferase n=1 Tax=Cacopsylla melanoneura TaxID=428564 RepID=A0A8D8YM04_9HEMI